MKKILLSIILVIMLSSCSNKIPDNTIMIYENIEKNIIVYEATNYMVCLVEKLDIVYENEAKSYVFVDCEASQNYIVVYEEHEYTLHDLFEKGWLSDEELLDIPWKTELFINVKGN